MMHGVPYHPAPFPPMVPPPPHAATGPEYPYAPYPPYPVPGAPAVAESGNEKKAQASPLQPVLPAPQGDHPGQPWQQHQRGFDPRNMPHGAGPRNFMRPPFMGQAPGFMVGPGPGFPGKILILCQGFLERDWLTAAVRTQ